METAIFIEIVRLTGTTYSHEGLSPPHTVEMREVNEIVNTFFTLLDTK